MLGGDLDCHGGRRDPTQHRGDVDHAATALGAHLGQHGGCDPHHAEDVDVEDLLDLVGRALLAGAVSAHASVVDQDVDATEPLHRLFDREADRLVAGQVEIEDVTAASGAAFAALRLVPTTQKPASVGASAAARPPGRGARHQRHWGRCLDVGSFGCGNDLCRALRGVACAQVDTVRTGLARAREDEGHQVAQVLGKRWVFGPRRAAAGRRWTRSSDPPINWLVLARCGR